MVLQPKKRNIAFRCPECGTATVGLVGKFALHANMLRLKCSCPDSTSLDVTLTGDGKIRLSVPCLFCKQNHSYVVSESLFFDKERFMLNCPYSGMDIAFIGDEDIITEELARTEKELNMLMASLEAEELSDIQPQDMPEAEILPDPAVYDTLRFVLKDLESDGKVKCPCGEGPYDIRFTDTGMQAFCERCGASYDFDVKTVTMAEEYLLIDSITLK